MPATASTTSINNVLPQIINTGLNLGVAQSRFFQEMNKVKKERRVNPDGVQTPYTVSENATAFAVAEGGPILSGSAPEYVMATAQLRQHWASFVYTGALERIQNQYLTQFRRNPANNGVSESRLLSRAQNYAVKDLIVSTLEQYARRENWFALQGTDKSAIGLVTGLPGSNVAEFSWDTTNQGNRLFAKDQQIQFFSPGGVQRVAGLPSTASSKFSTVTVVDDTPASGATGPVTFDLLPTVGGGATELQVGDTAVFRNSYGLMPQGFIHYVDDTGTFKGITRSDNPKMFSSVITRLSGSPSISPAHIREQLSQMESKMGYGVEFSMQIWMNKTQKYNWESQIYNSPFTRDLGTGKTRVDLAPGEMYWDGHKFMTDPDVPPGHVNFINFNTWQKIEQTPVQAYQFDSGSYIINPINSYGERLDQRQSTIFSEYNWDCIDPRSNGRIEGLAYNRIHI
ncbi:MAG TPA: hypothetical protein VJS44_08380 [Pyrinomonadaceae bacterium]|nr:hypothetical protein [Pyrinomonadaceae bacterium]